MKNHIYAFDAGTLTDPDRFAAWYDRMSPKRQEKIRAYRSESDKRLSLAAGILLEEALYREGIAHGAGGGTAHGAGGGIARAKGQESAPAESGPLKIEVMEDKGGKPRLRGDLPFFFSLSHTGEVAVCAVSDKETGADIERTRDFGESLLRYVFTDGERRETEDRFGIHAQEAYTCLWTVKESYLKYRGTGLAVSPKTIGTEYTDPGKASPMLLPGEEPEPLPLRVSGEELHFTCFRFRKHSLDYCVTVCSEYGFFADKAEWIDEKQAFSLYPFV